jgi:hypothetical protein
MAIKISSSSANTRRNKSDNNAKFTTPPHRRSTVLVKHPTQRIHRELGQTGKSIRKKFSFDIQMSSINRRSQILYAGKGRNSTIIYPAVEYNKKNYTEDVSDERAVDAFSAGLRRLDLVEELGRTRPKTVSELIEIASRFADGEDSYNNKRTRSPEVNRASRQRRRSRNKDGHVRHNQVATGYERGEEEGNESREYQDKRSCI